MSDEPDGVADSDPADVRRAENGVPDVPVNPTDAVGSSPARSSSSSGAPGQARRVPLVEDSAVGDDGEKERSSDFDLESDTDSPTDREAAVVGAAAAGSARAAARRSGVRAGATPVKGIATRPRDSVADDRVGLFARLGRFFREVVAELRKVIWPARNQMVTYTIVVIVFVVIMVAIVAGLDVLFAKGTLWIFG